MSQLIIRVGAAADRSLTDVFRPAIEAANRAKAAIEKSTRATADARVRATKAGLSQEEREYAKLVKTTDKWRQDEVKSADKAAKAQAAATAKSAKVEAAEADKLAKHWQMVRQKSADYAMRLAEKQASEEMRAEKRKTRELEQEMAKRKRDYDRYWQNKARTNNASQDKLSASRAEESAAMRAGGARAASLAGRGLRAAGGFAAGVAMDLARGAGVETDFGAMAQKNFALTQNAQDIANSGYQAGSARNGLRVSANELAGDSLRVGKMAGLDANDAMAGLGDFTSKTGDLATGREILADMAKLSKATGANLSDMMAAAGGVAMVMGDTENKGEKLNQIMNSFAAQGKLGAVEIKDLASQMDKLSAQAGQFEGNVADNMVMLGALAQSARKGGSSNATQAATSVAAFTSMLKTPKRAEEFKAATGVEVFNKKGMLRNPEELIIEALRSKGMNPTEFKKIFANVQGGRAVEESATIYRQAGGGAAGESAVRANFEQLKKASIDAAEAAESFALAMKQPKSQAEVFNQTMRETTMKMQNELTPALVALAPAVVEAAKATAKFVAWMTGSTPGGAAVAEAQSSVGSAIAASKKGVASGEVNSGQQALNFRAQGEADRALSTARAEAEKAKQGEKLGGVGAAMAGLYDNSLAGMMFRAGDKAFGSGKGNGIGGTITDSRHKDTVAADANVQAAEKLQQEMLATSKQLNDYIMSHPIHVKVVEGQLGPPGVPDAGRTPPPGQ